MKSIFKVFHRGLQKTATTFSRKIQGIFSENAIWTEETYEELEAALISSDFGTSVSLRIVDDIRDMYKRGVIKTGEDICNVAREEVIGILNKDLRKVDFKNNGLKVIMLVGVNGSGKTTTAGKLAHLLINDKKRVMLAACDTFRAAAIEQLNLWGKKTGANVVSTRHGADPSSVAYDAVKSALSKNYDYLIIDTAGRQHNKKALMEELSKMVRTVEKVYPEVEPEIWLVVDGSIGANALAQAREFSRFGGVNGLVFTKLDGTGKGGMVVTIKDQFSLPVLFVGLGEQPEDLQPFDPQMYTDAIFDLKEHVS